MAVLGVVIVAAVFFAILMIWIRRAPEADEDEVLFSHMNGLDREIRKPELEDLNTSADTDLKK